MKIETVILDRDGVLNHDSENYIKKPSELLFIDGSLDAINSLFKNKINSFIATNQSGINRGLYSLCDFLEINNKILTSIKNDFQENILSGIYYCPHSPDQHCLCRKPSCSMINNIVKHHNINLKKTAFIGDSLRDLEAAERAGCHYLFLVKTGNGLATLDKIKSELSAKHDKKISEHSFINQNFINNNIFDNLYSCVANIIKNHL